MNVIEFSFRDASDTLQSPAELAAENLYVSLSRNAGSHFDIATVSR